jgi:hypothetical protein
VGHEVVVDGLGEEERLRCVSHAAEAPSLNRGNPTSSVSLSHASVTGTRRGGSPRSRRRRC